MGCQQTKKIQKEQTGFQRAQTMKKVGEISEANQKEAIHVKEMEQQMRTSNDLRVDNSNNKELSNGGELTKDVDRFIPKDESTNHQLGYTFTINGKNAEEEEDIFKKVDYENDYLCSTEMREGNTPQLSQEDDISFNEKMYQKDISLADLGDGMIFKPLEERKATLKKAVTLKKASTLKSKKEKKQIIHTIEVQPFDTYFHPDFSKQFTQFTNKHSPKHYSKAITLVVPTF